MNVIGCSPIPVVSIILVCHIFVCFSLIYEITFVEYVCIGLFAFIVCHYTFCNFCAMGVAFIGK